jgi:hypothetical protein
MPERSRKKRIRADDAFEGDAQHVGGFGLEADGGAGGYPPAAVVADLPAGIVADERFGGERVGAEFITAGAAWWPPLAVGDGLVVVGWSW